jgi:D-3-phosphoglycerate dehydrogenase / 2-oxoglutarate reductase
MAKPLVIISSRSFSTGKLDLDKILKDSGCETRKISTTHEISEISSDLKDAVAWIAGVAPITTEMLDLAPNLRIISRYGVGVDSVDLGAAKRHGVLVANTPGANSNSVAELALSLMFSAIRNLSESDANVRSNNWKPIRGKEINGMVIGVVGYGKIGRLVANKLSLLGAKVLVNDPYVSDPAIVDLSVINKTAELVTLHSPGDEQIITNKWINDAPKGQIIINTARANLVDESALVDGLRSGKIGFFAADSISSEVTGSASPLLDDDLIDKTLFTPHIGGQTNDAIDLMGSMAVENVLAVLAGKPLRNQILL